MHVIPHEPSLRTVTPAAKDYLASVKFSQGPFDPHASWKQKWVIWLKHGNSPDGEVFLEKSPRPDGSFDLHVDWQVKQTPGGTQQLLATLNCSADDLATPRSWQAQSNILDTAMKPIESLTVKKDVKVKDGVLEFSGGQRRFADSPLKTWTSNWSLLEAIPRLGGKEITPLTFSMLDYLDEFKEEQTLCDLGTLDITLGGRAAQLHGYQQFGQGVMPTEYWLDEQKRLVILLGRERCLLAVD